MSVGTETKGFGDSATTKSNEPPLPLRVHHIHRDMIRKYIAKLITSSDITREK